VAGAMEQGAINIEKHRACVIRDGRHQEKARRMV
jgi:hypothetical protein